MPQSIIRSPFKNGHWGAALSQSLGLAEVKEWLNYHQRPELQSK